MGEQRLFISHASEDAAVAGKIVGYLEERGVACWIASRDIPPRAIYADAIVAGMQACSACVVLVSAASNASKAVKREVELASHEDKAFIPIRIDGSEPASGLAYYLRSTQWVDYNREGPLALNRIAAAGRQPPPRPPPMPDTHRKARPSAWRPQHVAAAAASHSCSRRKRMVRLVPTRPQQSREPGSDRMDPSGPHRSTGASLL